MPHIPHISNTAVALRPQGDTEVSSKNIGQYAGRDVAVVQPRTPSMQHPAALAPQSNLVLETAAYRQFQKSADTARKMAEIDYAQKYGVDVCQFMDIGDHFANRAGAAFKDAFILAFNRGDKKSDALKFACNEAKIAGARSLTQSDLPGSLDYANFMQQCELKFEGVRSQYSNHEHTRIQYRFQPAPQKPPRTFAYDADLAALKNTPEPPAMAAANPIIATEPVQEAAAAKPASVAEPTAPIITQKPIQRSFKFRRLPRKAARKIQSTTRDLLRFVKSKIHSKKAAAKRALFLKPELQSNPAYDKKENIFDVLLKSKHAGVLNAKTPDATAYDEARILRPAPGKGGL